MRLPFVFVLLVLGFETLALAHEDPASLSSNPIDWLLPVLAYVLPELMVVVLLNIYASRLHLLVRLVFAIVFPLIFWLVVLYLLWSPDRSFLTLLLELPRLVLERTMALLLVSSSIVIAALGMLDHRRRLKTLNAEVFAET
ncbi:hypothetical protein [Qipengyuania psychrotolerans]|uniref:Uncharacterized protein n=1 Tax=Qipengyuania psychrotolerans TaxID=2867238 RepID=A0ABX8ZGB6_9SPHN|nr:hypothetical protein [Qipengyuania psychrotolerans]QZD88055.1 hypothetical protein K3166_05100 [Qipengyuania psychrotolerans]